MTKKYLLAAALGVLVCMAGVAILYIQRNRVPQEAKEGKSVSLHIVSSIYPLTFFTQQLVGDLGSVTTITPPGAEPHEYEPTSQDIVLLEGADLIVLNGANLEPWAEKLINPLRNKGTQVVVAAEGIANQRLVTDGEKIQDPHVWLSPALAKTESQAIAQALQMADPAHATRYQQNEKIWLERLDSLYKAFHAGLSACQRQDFVTSHSAFGYLATQYGLNQVPISGISPEAEPSGRELAQVATFVRQNDIKVIFFESLVSPKLSQAIARETGAAVMELNPLEGLTPDEIAQGKDYTSVMQNNLRNLQNDLVC